MRLLILIVLSALTCSCDENVPEKGAIAAEAVSPVVEPVQSARSGAAAQAMALLAPLSASPDSTQLRVQLVQLFDVVFVAEQVAGEPLLNAVPGEVLLQVNQFAQAGDPVFLAALMRAADGWYGGTAEGGEWLNELLWSNLTVQPQLSLTVLAQFPRATRSRLLKRIYTAPVTDAFDFGAILAGLRVADVPPGLEEDVEQIIATVKPLMTP